MSGRMLRDGVVRRAAILLMLALAAADLQPAIGQGSAADQGAQAATTLAPSPIPLTYEPAAARKAPAARRPDVGRAFIIAVGSLPFTVFYTDFAFDSVRFALNGFDLQYAPWPFKNQYSAGVEPAERFMRLGAALGVSAVIGILDLVLQR